MNTNGWRILILALIGVILAGAGGVGWRSGFTMPGVLFYFGAAIVALLVWLDVRRGWAKQEPNETGDDETTSPAFHDNTITKV